MEDNLAVRRLLRAEVIEVGADQYGLSGKRGIGAAQHGVSVVGDRARRQRNALELGLVEAQRLKLGYHVGGGYHLIARGAATPAHGVGGEERHRAAHMGRDLGAVDRGGVWAGEHRGSQ